jgi:hypothetical protein
VATRKLTIALLWIVAAIAPGAYGAPAYQGMSYTPWSENVLLSADSDQSIANMAAVGVDTVALNVWSFQDDEYATDIALDFSRYSASLPSIEHAIDEIHSQGMQVMLKPMVDLRNGAWRAGIVPSTAWFNEYKSYMNDWATFADDNGVEMLSVGCELSGTQSWESSWREVIAGVRARYSGPLTYSANHDAYGSIAWWDDLDYVGIDAYFQLASQNDPTLAQLQASWQGLATTIQTWRTGQGLTQNVLFTEVGYRSADGAVQAPWDYSTTGTVDLQEQVDAYTALLSVMTNRSWFDGAFWWNWETNPNAGGSSDTGYTPQNKPAQNVVSACYLNGDCGETSGGTARETLYSWEPDLEGWQVPSYHNKPASLAQSTIGATDGDHSLAVSETVATAGESHFSWNATVQFSGDDYAALAAALADGAENYMLELDVTYDTDFIPSVTTWMNGSIAFQSNSGWSQVDGVAGTNGHTDQTITLSLPLTSWSTLTPGSSFYTMIIAMNGNWGAGTATVFYDNLVLVNLNGLEGDYNGDGVVDAADYTVWRDSLGQTGANLPADGDGDGEVTEADYTFWRERFGNTASSGSLAVDFDRAAVPEPATGVLLLLAMAGFVLFRRGTR